MLKDQNNHKRAKLGVAVSAAAVLLAAGCSSSSKGATPSGSTGSGGPTYTVGLLTDLTGPAAATELDTPKGVEAGVGVARSEGYHIKYVVADTGTSPAGALTAAHKLVEQDHVFAVLAASALTFAAAPYLASQGVPVVGAAEDGSEWISTKSMFSIFGYQDFTKVGSTIGKFLHQEGGTVVGTVGTGISPSSAEAAKAAAVSAQVAGLKVGYVNANLPYGTTNVGPMAIAMKSAGVDSLVPAIDQVTAFALIKALRTEGVNLKVALLPTGYGGDLVNGGPGAADAAQGVYFQTSWEPVEMHTAATIKLENALKTYAGWSGDPTFGEYLGYLSVDGFVQGLKAAGPNPTRASLINTMLGITNYSGAGLYGGHTISFAMSTRGQSFGADNCIWATKFVGHTFQVVQGAAPICGTIIPGKSVSASS
ncbi:MAG TPA: ABC transporter substrate-binding protein [Acidimicrobiales bacterium]|nr:ABC transporter substrate-binding protein [Acidimicrobiales bacterium]